jgi:hypothetical protein
VKHELQALGSGSLGGALDAAVWRSAGLGQAHSAKLLFMFLREDLNARVAKYDCFGDRANVAALFCLLPQLEIELATLTEFGLVSENFPQGFRNFLPLRPLDFLKTI